MSKLDTRVIQVTNVAPTTTKEQLKTLFQFIGRIRDCKLFPPEGSDQQVAAKVCYVEFEDSTAAGVALHLTNTVFIDRALIVVPVMDGKIPDEKVAMQLTPQTVARMAPGQPSWPTNVVSQLTGTGIDQVITTYDPRLNALGLPQYPPLPPTLDAAKVEEVRRTVYVGNLDPKTTPESLISFFSQAGEVKYVRMAGEDTSIARAAYLELTDQRSVANYLGYNGVLYNGRPITVSHAKSSINKPLTKSQEASRREVEEAMKKVQEAQALISAAASEKFVTRSRSRSRRRSRSRSRSRSKRRSRSRSRGRRRRSRSRSRRKSRSPRRVRRSRSRSPRRRRSRSRSGFVVIPARERRRSRSTSRPRRRSRSRSKRRSRTPPRAYSGRHSRSRSKGPRRKSRSRTPRRSRSRSRGKGKDKKEKVKESEKKKKEKKVSRSRSLSPPTLHREGSAAGHSGDDRSPGRLDPSAKEDSGKQSQTETVSQAALPQGAKKTRSEAASEKKSSQKRDRSESPTAGRRAKSVSRSPVRGSRRRSASRSPVKSSRRRSVSPRKRRSKSRSPRRSRSPAKKKKARSPRRSRSGSRHRSKKDKKKERSRSKERKEKKKKNKDKKEEKEKEKGAASSSSKAVTRNYDEEEKGFNSASDREEEMRSQKDEYEDDRRSGGADRQLVDMDTSD